MIPDKDIGIHSKPMLSEPLRVSHNLACPAASSVVASSVVASLLSLLELVWLHCTSESCQMKPDLEQKIKTLFFPTCPVDKSLRVELLGNGALQVA